MKNNVRIQIGDKPGWKKPVLIVFIDYGTPITIPITQKVKKALLATGKLSIEG